MLTLLGRFFQRLLATEEISVPTIVNSIKVEYIYKGE